ncbi:MAG: metallophosphoesterase family protein [Planctomycetota bacterium]|jgi:diadenosine tetraphosphatase ApaH/serine/threonine PP2A family protein phosphatase
MEYILRSDCIDLTGGVPEKIRDIFSRFERLCFVGHTHDPGVITEDSRFLHPGEVDHKFEFEEGKKYLVNVGSVGQPRDGDPRACYVVFDRPNKIQWRRIEYDFRKTMEKIFNNPKLDPRAGERLAHGR